MELHIIDGLRTSHLKKAHQVGLLEGGLLPHGGGESEDDGDVDDNDGALSNEDEA